MSHLDITNIVGNLALNMSLLHIPRNVWRYQSGSRKSEQTTQWSK